MEGFKIMGVGQELMCKAPVVPPNGGGVYAGSKRDHVFQPGISNDHSAAPGLTDVVALPYECARHGVGHDE